jgi:hypothetical protein
MSVNQMDTLTHDGNGVVTDEQAVSVLTSSVNEASAVMASEVLQQTLYSEADVQQAAATGLAIKNVVAGIASLNLRGSGWHTFVFDIETHVRPTRAVVALGLLNIYNNSTAKNLQYHVSGYSLSYRDTKVRVTGRVFVGDSDGYLFGFGYNCTVF